eukprot:832794-Rhodomonas_salina.3
MSSLRDRGGRSSVWDRGGDLTSSRKGAGRSGSTVNSSMLLSCRHRSSVLIFSRNLLIWNCVFRSRSPVWYVIASRTVDIRSGYLSEVEVGQRQDETGETDRRRFEGIFCACTPGAMLWDASCVPSR